MANKPNKQKDIHYNLKLDQATHRNLKILAIMEDMTLQEVIMDAIRKMVKEKEGAGVEIKKAA